MKSIRIFLADDHELLRFGLTTLLQFEKDFKVIGCAENGEQAVELAKKLRPDVVVMDLMMPRLDGVEATRLILAELPETKIMLLTSFGSAADVIRAINAGAHGALVKDTPNSSLISAIREIAAGKKVFSPEIKKMIDSEPPPPDFTPRQLEVLNAVTRGFTNAEIANILQISSDAVKQHIIGICEKLGASNRAEAVAIALRKHLLKL